MENQILLKQIKHDAGMNVFMAPWFMLLGFGTAFFLAVFIVPWITGRDLISYPAVVKLTLIAGIALVISLPLSYFIGKISKKQQCKVLDDEIQTTENLINHYENSIVLFEQEIAQKKALYHQEIIDSKNKSAEEYAEMRKNYIATIKFSIDSMSRHIANAANLKMDAFEKIQHIAYLEQKKLDLEEEVLDIISKNQKTEEQEAILWDQEYQRKISNYDEYADAYKKLQNEFIKKREDKLQELKQLKKDYFS